MKNKKYIVAFFLLLSTVSAFAVSSDGNTASVFTQIINFLKDIKTIVPLLGSLALTLFAWLLLLGLPIGGYYVAYRQFKKNDERNETDTSGVLTHAKASGISLVAFVMGLFLFQLIYINGLNLDKAIGGSSSANFGTVAVKVLSLDFD